MSNCKSGDVAVITWDEEPIFSNVGKLVKVSGTPEYDARFGLTWLITPVENFRSFLYIDDDDNEAVKRAESGDEKIWHPDGWMRPLENPDELCEETKGVARTETAITSA